MIQIMTNFLIQYVVFTAHVIRSLDRYFTGAQGSFEGVNDRMNERMNE